MSKAEKFKLFPLSIKPDVKSGSPVASKCSKLCAWNVAGECAVVVIARQLYNGISVYTERIRLEAE